MVQFLIILSLLNKQYGGHGPQHSAASLDLQRSQRNDRPSAASVNQLTSLGCSSLHVPFDKPPAGVAVTLLLHAPTWFQRRYTMMIQNTISNIPEDWVVQIFYTPAGQSQHGLDISPGIQRYVKTGKVVLVPIPSSVLTVKKKRFELMFAPWIWEQMLADTVLIFGGNAVICSNSPLRVGNFSDFDYLGSPWGYKKGAGGDGGISIRSRKAMLAAIEYALRDVDEAEKETAFKAWGQEDQFYVRTLLEMNEKAGAHWKVAARNDTLRFSAIGSAVNNDVLVVSGTLPDVPYDDRQSFLNVCPEIKMFYPSLHDPHCFGAQPDGDKCAKSICALKSKKERRGGC
jgi:hypothetical protein